MATDKGSTEAQMVDTGRAAGHPDIPIQVKITQVPARCGPSAAMQPPPTAAGFTKGNSVSPHPKVPPAGQSTHPTSSTVADSALQTSSAVMVIAKVATPGGGTANGQPQVTKPTLSQVASMNQTTMSGRTMMITVPRTGSPQTLAVAPRLPQAAPQLPANIHIPPGMMLIRSDSGQLMLVSQQALAQAQQGSRSIIGQAPRILTQQVSVAAGNKINEKVTVIRMTAPPRFQPAPGQKTAVVKVIGVSPQKVVVQNLSPVSDQGRQPRMQAVVIETKKEPPATYSQETMESVKKCKNFLVTLIKLASSGSRSANMANNVKGLVQSLLEGRLEAEEFTQQLYQELKSTPQPCLVPFLKKSLPAVRCLTPDPQLFIQQASTPTTNSTMMSSSTKHTNADTGKKVSSGQQIIQPLRGLTLRPEMMTLSQSRYCNTKSSRPSPKHTVVQPGKHFTGTISLKQTFSRDPSQLNKSAFPDSSGSYKEDDDINDVASMAGVNLREENAQIFTTIVGSVVQSCQDQPFLSHCPVLNRILHTGQAFGVTEIGPEVVALVSHATQECLRGLIEKLTVMAEHRKEALKGDLSHTKVSDVRGQLRFLEEVESLKKKRKDEEERERLLRLAKIRSHTDDLQHQQLKQRAKELQQIEEAQLQQREANLTALAAIGPRKKRALEQSQSKVTLLPRPGVQRVNRVVLKDLLLCLEQEHFFRHSLTFYKAMF